MIKILLGLVFALFLLLPQTVHAEDQFITIVNPVRVSLLNPDPVESLKAQYQQISENSLSASWLLTYDILTHPGISEQVKAMDKNQDIGIFLEISENFAKAAGVEYNKTDSWHRANSIFLSGYSQEDRVKLIDKVFEEFKNQFGYYPASVGSWWTDSYSLEYMQKKYGVYANLVVADQLGTDGYTIWGQPWGMPYYPSKIHAAIPAKTDENKLDIVNLQWAPRDPLNGYQSPDPAKRSSLYSTQDYYTIGLPDEYLENLINLYAAKNKNNFGQITFGLEGDLKPDAYLKGSQFSKYLDTALKFKNSGNFNVTNMKQFAAWYKQNFPDTSGNYFIETDDLLKGKNKSFWFQNLNYRTALIFDKQNAKLKLIDLRIYQDNYQEPFYNLRNGNLDLVINTPSVIDTLIDPQRFFEIDNVTSVEASKNNSIFRLNLNDNRILEFLDDRIVMQNTNKELPQFIKDNQLISFQESNNDLAIIANKKFPIDETYSFKDLNLETSYFLNTKKAKSLGLMLLLSAGIGIWGLLKIKGKKKSIFAVLLILPVILVSSWYFKNLENYQVSQQEVEALLKLRTYPAGRILVLDRDCLHCQTILKSPVFANKRVYVEKLTNKKVLSENKLIETYAPNMVVNTKLNREEAKEYLKNLNVDYIYLTKIEDYSEKLPFSPGDLSVEQIYFNSSAEIWRVKK